MSQKNKQRKYSADCVKGSPVNFDEEPSMFILGRNYAVTRIDEHSTEVSGLFKSRHNAYKERTLNFKPEVLKNLLVVKGVFVR